MPNSGAPSVQKIGRGALFLQKNREGRIPPLNGTVLVMLIYLSFPLLSPSFLSSFPFSPFFFLSSFPLLFGAPLVTPGAGPPKSSQDTPPDIPMLFSYFISWVSGMYLIPLCSEQSIYSTTVESGYDYSYSIIIINRVFMMSKYDILRSFCYLLSVRTVSVQSGLAMTSSFLWNRILSLPLFHKELII